MLIPPIANIWRGKRGDRMIAFQWIPKIEIINCVCLKYTHTLFVQACEMGRMKWSSPFLFFLLLLGLPLCTQYSGALSWPNVIRHVRALKLYAKGQYTCGLRMLLARVFCFHCMPLQTCHIVQHQHSTSDLVWSRPQWKDYKYRNFYWSVIMRNMFIIRILVTFYMMIK